MESQDPIQDPPNTPENKSPEPEQPVPNSEKIPEITNVEPQQNLSESPPVANSGQLPQPPQETASVEKKEKEDDFGVKYLQSIAFGNFFFIFAKKTPKPVPRPDRLKEYRPALVVPKKPPTLTEIFALFGQDTKLRQSCLHFFQELGVDPVLLESDVLKSKSIEECFVTHAHIPFAVVVLSGDEFIYGKDSKPALSKLGVSPNIAFKLGYLLARLGKDNVFVLYHEQKSFILPTPILNCPYFSLDAAKDWQRLLAARLIQKGYKLKKNLL